MRGENPVSFPIRLFPKNIPAFSSYPTSNPRGTTIPREELEYYTHLPLVPILLKGDTLRATALFSNQLQPTKKGGLSTFDLDKLVHAGNFIVPASATTQGQDIESYTARTNWDSLGTVFTRQSIGGETRYTPKTNDISWMVAPRLSEYSPKFDFFIERVKRAEGCVFAYTRFVQGGAIPLALVLEANGYKPWGRKSGLLNHKPIGGYQCALCEHRESNHPGNHDFSQAYYGILTGELTISPDNEKTIKAQRHMDNVNGVKMKVLIGSQIASEGVDLRFVRETHVIDSWYHLNKTEQILGRAIRFLSHCALPQEKRNNTVYLYTAVLPPNQNKETADLYSYRMGFNKAVLIGNVTRVMKQAAVDCNLNKDAIIISGEETVRQIDSQRLVREEVDINDMPFTAVCDWIETCNYKCSPQIDLKELVLDDSTYDEYAARWSIYKIKKAIRTLFEIQSFYQSEDVWESLSNLPKEVVVDVLREVVNNKSFQVKHQNIAGYIRYCNGYYLFQPNVYADLSIPLAIRVAKFPVKRDEYLPIEYEIPEDVKEEESEQPVSFETIEVVWQSIVDWITYLSMNPEYRAPPVELDHRRIEMSHDDKALLLYYTQVFQMVQWFHTSFHESNNPHPESFEEALLTYFWDEWLTIEEQLFIVYQTGLNVHLCIKENEYQFGKEMIHRFIDPKSGELIYMCEGPKTCSTAIIDHIKSDPDDRIRTFSMTTKTTSTPYGFLVPKKSKMVFKMADVPKTAYVPGNKQLLPRGKECGIVTAMTGHESQLLQIGNIFREHGNTDFGLNPSTILLDRPVRNSTRACTLLNFLMRFLDAEQIDGKRWFFRPVMARYLGYTKIK
jgi:hypothetical protein